MENYSVAGNNVTKTLDYYSYKNEALSKEPSPLRKSGATCLRTSGLVNKAVPSSSISKDPRFSIAERSSIVTPKQNTLVRGKRIESTDSYQMYPSQPSTKNLNPRAIKNRYQPSTKRQEFAK